MNIDERLEKLAERHESLTHAVELLARMHGDSEPRLAEHERLLTEIDERLKRLAAAQNESERLLAAFQQASDQRFAEVHDILNETAQIQRQQASEILKHAKLLSEHDERMDRVGRHLEVLIDLVDGMIRGEKK